MKDKKYLLGGVATALTVAVSPMVAFAETSSGAVDVTTPLVTACTDMASSIGGAVGQVLPIALPLVGMSLVVTIGLKVFKRVSAKV